MHPTSLALFVAGLLALGCATPKAEAVEHGGHSHAHAGPMQHRFEDPERWAKVFEDSARDAWQKPDQVIAALALPKDAKVADLGSATGYFAVRLARAVPEGKVYGVDVEPGMAEFLEQRAAKEKLTNLVSVLGAPDDPKLPEAVDLVLIVDTYHHLGDRPRYFQSLSAKLRPGGRVAVVDFRKDSPRGPPAEHKLEASQVEQELTAAGYRKAASHDFLPDQYFLVFERARR